MHVIKRDGTRVLFDPNKIVNAINAAFIEVDGKLYETDTAVDIAHDIELRVLNNSADVEVETIQDWVEDYLMRSERRDVARAYIRYRYKKEVARSYSDDFIKAIGEKLNATNVQNQNANVDEASFGGRIGEAASVMTKRYALDFLVSDMARKNHENNEIYIHDLDAYAVGSHNCLSIPFDDLLANGFNTRQGDIRPAGSINTAFQLVAVIFQLQSLQQFGGVSATHIDWTMVPYVRKSFYKHFLDGVFYCQDNKMINIMGVYETFDLTDAKSDWIKNNASIDNKLFLRNEKAYKYAMEMTEKETMQAVEAMYHNLNTLQSRSGNQLN